MKKQSLTHRKALPRTWRAAFERLDAALRENTTRINDARKIAILRKIAAANVERLKAPGELNRIMPKQEPQYLSTLNQLSTCDSDS